MQGYLAGKFFNTLLVVQGGARAACGIALAATQAGL